MGTVQLVDTQNTANKISGLGDSPGSQVLILSALSQSSIPRTHVKKARCGPCNPSAREVETGRSTGLAD